MNFHTLKLTILFASAMALAACGGQSETESFTVTLENVEVVDQSNVAVSVNTVGITNSGSVEK